MKVTASEQGLCVHARQGPVITGECDHQKREKARREQGNQIWDSTKMNVWHPASPRHLLLVAVGPNQLSVCVKANGLLPAHHGSWKATALTLLKAAPAKQQSIPCPPPPLREGSFSRSCDKEPHTHLTVKWLFKELRHEDHGSQL